MVLALIDFCLILLLFFSSHRICPFSNKKIVFQSQLLLFARLTNTIHISGFLHILIKLKENKLKGKEIKDSLGI